MNESDLLNSSKKFLDWELIKSNVLMYSFLKKSSESLIFETPLFAPKEHYSILNDICHKVNDDTQFLISNVLARTSDIDTATTIYHLDKSPVLSLREIHIVASAIESFFDLSKIFEPFINIDFEVHTFKQKIKRDFLNEVRSFIDIDGNINLSSHPMIRSLFEEQKLIDDKIRKTLQFVLTDNELQNILRFTGHDIISDRFVIAIRSDSYSSSLGFIIDRSETGQTLYLEPHAIRELNQKRIELIVKIDEIINKICMRLSSELSRNVEVINKIFNFIKQVDYYYTLIRYTDESKSCIPLITDDLAISLEDFFHPLIINPIKNDFKLKSDDKGLVISGPNTGGKTAVLKAIGISVLFSKYGLPIPARSAAIGAYKNVFYFGSDYQDLTKGLSSFSAEVQEYYSLFKLETEESLIIIDEIFNSTASDEASALASAFIEELTSVFKCQILLSTHHQLLKTIFHQRNDFISAHVGFDIKTNRPTYKLHLGTPGSSHALNIFDLIVEASVFKKSISKLALSYLNQETLNYEKLIMDLTSKHHEIDQKILELEKRERKLEQNEKAQEGLLKLRIDAEYEKFEKKMNQAFSKAEAYIEEAKNNQTTSSFNKIANKKNELLREIKPQSNAEVKKRDFSKLQQALKIKIGQSYFSYKFDKLVRVSAINERKREAQITAGIIKATVPFEDLFESQMKVRTETEVKVFINKSGSAQIEYDCRGMRLSEFQSLVEGAISDLMSSSLPFISIIHGHGNGILKKWLRDYLKNNPNVQIDHSDSGNDGETRIITR